MPLVVRTLTVITLTLLLVLIAGTGWLKLQGDQLLSVQTASMLPTFSPGDALVVKPVKTSSLKPGQIISYHSPRNPNIIITHRLVRINRHTGWLTTEGDARLAPDPSFSPQLVTGQAIVLLPSLGKVLATLRTPLGLGLVIYLPASLVIMSEIRRLSSSYARPYYSARL